MDIIRNTEGNSIALHRKSNFIHVVFNSKIERWLAEELGGKRLLRLTSLQTLQAFDSRYKNRGATHIKYQLINALKALVTLLKNNKCNDCI